MPGTYLALIPAKLVNYGSFYNLAVLLLEVRVLELGNMNYLGVYMVGCLLFVVTFETEIEGCIKFSKLLASCKAIGGSSSRVGYDE